MALVDLTIGNGAIFTVRLGSDDGLLWWIEDEEIRYTHWLHIGRVDTSLARGIQIVLGPVLCSLLWIRQE